MKNHLRALRESRGWTQGALADQLDVSRQTVNALETGRYDPSLPLAFRVARLFDRPIEAIFEPEPEPEPDPATRSQVSTGADGELFPTGREPGRLLLEVRLQRGVNLDPVE